MTALPPSGAFTMVDPAHVAEVGPAAAILFGRIAWRAQEGGEWVATRAVLAAETGLSDATLRTAVAVLRDRGWVETRRVSTLDATLIWTPVYAGQTEKAESAISTWSKSQDPPAESAISSLETGKTDTPLPPTDAGLFASAPPLRVVPTPTELDAEFSRFWELYPRKTGKKAARTAYRRARRTATVQQIAAGLVSQVPAMRAKVEAGDAQYVPHPTTWLNQGRWEDEVPASTPSASQGDTYDPAYAATLPPPLTEPRSWGVGR